MPNSKSSPKTVRRAHAAKSRFTHGSQNQAPSTQTQYVSQDHQHQQSFTNTQRDWPQAYFAWPPANDASNVTTTSRASYETVITRNLTPMERWQMEASRHGPYDSVGCVATGNREGVNREATAGTDSVGTDDGSWWPYGVVRGPGEA